MIAFLRKRPWLLVVAAFLLLISAWAALFFVARLNSPAPFLEPDPAPLHHEEHHGDG